MSNDESRALGLSERCEVLLRHCGKAMEWEGSGATWEGKPGHGAEINETRYSCGTCRATVTVTARDPD